MISPILVLLFFHHQQPLFEVLNFYNENTRQRDLNTRFSRKNRPESKPLFFHHHVNNLSRRTIVSTERGDRLRQIGQEQRMADLLPLRECEVWMNVKSPLGRAKWIFWLEMKDTVL